MQELFRMDISSKNIKEKLIAEINSSIFDRISPDRNLIIYSGSFSRDEETLLKVNNNYIYLSDIEFTIFQEPLSYIFKRQHKIIKENIKKISIKYNIKIDYDIKPAISSYFIPKTFFWYETLNIKMIFGRSFFWRPPKINNKNIISGDIYEILNHSIIAVFKKIIKFKECSKEANELKYQIIKSSADIFIPFLAVNGKIIPTHSKRLNFIMQDNNDIIINKEFKTLAKLINHIKFPNNYEDLNKSLKDISIDNAIMDYKNLFEESFRLIGKKNMKIKSNPYGFISVLRIIHTIKYKLRLALELKFNLLFINATKLIYLNHALLNQIHQKGIDKININDLKKNIETNKIIYRYLV